jgi:hypothetical protein
VSIRGLIQPLAHRNAAKDGWYHYQVTTRSKRKLDAPAPQPPLQRSNYYATMTSSERRRAAQQWAVAALPHAFDTVWLEQAELRC